VRWDDLFENSPNGSTDPLRSTNFYAEKLMSKATSVLSTALNPYTGAWGFAQAAHVLRRCTFGATPKDIAAVQQMTMSQAVDLLLADQPPETSAPLVWYHYDIGGVTQGQTWVHLDYDLTNDFNRTESLAAWWLGLMLAQPISIREKMTLFWHNHFACGAGAVGDARYSYQQLVLLRANALGNFKTLVKEITLDPAMLRYLSGNQNVSSAPNENYGRELQELFTIGKGAEVSTGDYTTYTEADVKAAAHVLTGWRDDPKTLAKAFSAADHDTKDKQFSARYGNTVIKGSSDESGAERELDDMLTMIFNQDANARYIARKIYRWFVDYVIDDTIEANVIGPLADCLKANSFEVKPVLSLLLKSAHFYDVAYAGCVIKTPMDYIIGSIRTLGVEMPLDEGLITQYFGWIGLRLTGGSLQMKLLEPPNVAGWPAYYQAPEYHEIWLNADTLDSRIKFVDDIATNKYAIAVQVGYHTTLDLTTLVAVSSDPSNPDTLIADWARLFYANPLTTIQMKTLHDTLLPGLPNYEWANEWNDHVNNPSDAVKKKTVTDKLTPLVLYMLELAEYQLM
jgi:uncharacterized protein (DUF1800 family)